MFTAAQVAEALRDGRVVWRSHALQRMIERGIDRAAVLATLESGEIIEEYEDDHPHSSALVLGYTGEQPLHVVVAFDHAARGAYIITVYEPSPDRFEPDWRTRRTP